MCSVSPGSPAQDGATARDAAPDREADVLFAADLHGSEPLYDELLALARRLRVRALVLGGDLAPHATPPQQREFWEKRFLPRFRNYRAEAGSADVYFVLGNDDWRCGEALLEGAGIDRFHDIHARAMPFSAGGWIAGLGSVVATPFRMKDWDRWEEGLPLPLDSDGFRSRPDGALEPFSFAGRERVEDIALELSAVDRALPADAGPLVLAFHCPPHGTSLDQIHGGIHVGSREVRRFIERRQPAISLHGHIHESPEVSGRFADHLGRTICVNPGRRMAGPLQAVWFKMTDVAGTLTHTTLGRAVPA